MQGHHVMKTVGKGIVITDSVTYQTHNDEAAPDDFKTLFPDGRLPDLAILVALLSAGFFVTLATFSSVPVSTSQAIVGGVAGVGVGIVGLEASYFKIAVLLRILGAWVISPVLTMILAFAVYLFLGLILRQARAIFWTTLLWMLVALATCAILKKVVEAFM